MQFLKKGFLFFVCLHVLGPVIAFGNDAAHEAAADAEAPAVAQPAAPAEEAVAPDAANSEVVQEVEEGAGDMEDL